MNYRNGKATPITNTCGHAFSQNTINRNSSLGCNRASAKAVSDRSYGCQIPSAYNNPRSCNRSTYASNRRGSCGSDNGHIHREAPIAMVYSPMQQWKDLYDPHTALTNGTIFKELDLPFYPTPCRRKENSQCQCR